MSFGVNPSPIWKYGKICDLLQEIPYPVIKIFFYENFPELFMMIISGQ